MFRSTIFTNATIETGRNEECPHDSVLVIENNIVKLGTLEECKALAEEELTIIDCEKKSLLPGFIDAHNHITLLGASLRASKFHYPEVSSIDDVVDVVKKAAAENETVGRHTLRPQHLIARRDLRPYPGDPRCRASPACGRHRSGGWLPRPVSVHNARHAGRYGPRGDGEREDHPGGWGADRRASAALRYRHQFRPGRGPLPRVG